MSLNKLYRCVILWLSGRYAWVTIIFGLVHIVFGAWSQLPNGKIVGYRPDDQILFLGIIASPVILTAMGMIRSLAKTYENSDVKTKHKKEVAYLQDTIFEERKEALKDHLREIAEGLQFTMQERICVYRFLETEKKFECIGRYSLHYDYNQLSDRKRYPLNMGIIAHVWGDGNNNGFKRDQDIPALSPKSSSKNKKKYYEYLDKTYGIPKDVAEKFRMHPVDIIAEVVRDTKNKPVAVIIFESKRKNFLDEEKLKQHYNDFKKRAIIASLDKLKEQHVPDLNTAKEAQI